MRKLLGTVHTNRHGDHYGESEVFLVTGADLPKYKGADQTPALEFKGYGQWGVETILFGYPADPNNLHALPGGMWLDCGQGISCSGLLPILASALHAIIRGES